MIDLEKGKNNPKGIKDKPSYFKYGNKDDVFNLELYTKRVSFLCK